MSLNSDSKLSKGIHWIEIEVAEMESDLRNGWGSQEELDSLKLCLKILKVV